jgi:transcriptional regulator with XRE-family HTH domain
MGIKMLNFAKILKEYRTNNNLSLYELSKLSGVSPQALSEYELNKRIPSFDKAQEILNCLKAKITIK